MNVRTELLTAICDFETALSTVKVIIQTRINPRLDHAAIAGRQPALERIIAGVIDQTAILLAKAIEAGASGDVEVDLSATLGHALRDAGDDARHEAWERTRHAAGPAGHAA